MRCLSSVQSSWILSIPQNSLEFCRNPFKIFELPWILLHTFNYLEFQDFYSVHWHIFCFMWLRRIYEFLCVHSNRIWKGRNCRVYRPSHLTFREYFRLFWFSRSCVVVAYCNIRMRSSNVQGFVSTVPTLYEEEEDYAPLYRNRRICISIFTLCSSLS